LIRQFKKYYTLEEARRILPELKVKLKKIIELKAELDRQGFDIFKHQYFGGRGVNGTGEHPEELENLVKLLEELTSDGIVIKGIGNGLVDIPYINKNGDEVFLCYLYGEDDIKFWHGIDEGYAERKTL
jgi:hypothetical protein